MAEASRIAASFLDQARAIQADIDSSLGPPAEGRRSSGDAIIAMSRFRNTRTYLERICDQINITYKEGCYDACAILIRRLMETLLIESFEAKGISNQIKDVGGNYIDLRLIIPAAIQSASFSLSRGAKIGMSSLKELGDQSAHARRFIAHRSDLDQLRPKVRLVTDELLHEAGFR